MSYSKNGTSVASGQAITYAGSSTSSGNAWSYVPFSITAGDYSHDGIYSFTFTATDAAGKTATVTQNLTVDTMPPQLTVTTPPATLAWYSGSPVKMAGVADDGTGSGVKIVYLKAATKGTDLSGQDPTVTANSWTTADGTVSWSKSLAVSSEGLNTLWVKAYDNDGNTSTTSVDFGYDKTAPTLTETDSVPAAANAAFSLTGKASDSGSGVASLTLSVDSSTASSLSLSSGAWTYNVSVDATGHLNDGTHSYLLTLTDNAGNVSTITKTVQIDTKAPAISFSNISASSTQTIVDATPKILGTVTDDTGVGSASTVVDYSSDNGTTWTNVETSTALSLSGSNSKSMTFAKDLSGTTFATDGLYRIAVTVADSLSTPNSSTTSPIKFRLDRTNPVVGTLTSSAASSSVNANFTLSGSASSNSLSMVEYCIDSGSFTTLASGLTTSSYSFSGASAISVSGSTLSEGAHTVTIQAVSTGQRIGSQTYSFLVDRTAPTPTISQPVSGTYVSGTSVTLAGAASDSGTAPSGISSVGYQIVKGFSVTANTSTETFTSGSAHGLSSGNVVFFSVYSDGALPTGITAGTAYYVISAGLTTTTFEVSATSSGTTAVNLGGSPSGVWAAKVGSSWTGATYGASSWNASIDSTGYSEGSYYLFSKATDAALNASSAVGVPFIVDQGAPSLDLSSMTAGAAYSAGFTFSGTATDPKDSSLYGATNGIASVKISLGDSSFPAAHIATITSGLTTGTAWSYSLASAPASFFNGLTGAPASFAGLADGQYTLYVRAVDKAGRPTDSSYSFIKDTTAPAASFNNVKTDNSAVIQDPSPQLSGTATDANGVAKVEIEIDSYSLATSTWTPGSFLDLGVASGNKSQPWSYDVSGLAEGLYRVTLRLTDVAIATPNVTTVGAYQFRLDRTAPTATVASPATGLAWNKDLTLSGTVASANLQTLTAQLDSGTPATVSFAAANNAWTYSLPNASLTEAAHTVTLVATDYANKISTVAFSLIKDVHAPTVSYNNLTANQVFPDSSPKITGTISDASGIATATGLLQSYNYGTSTWTAVSGMNNTSLGITAGATSGNFTIDMKLGGAQPRRGQVPAEPDAHGRHDSRQLGDDDDHTLLHRPHCADGDDHEPRIRLGVLYRLHPERDGLRREPAVRGGQARRDNDAHGRRNRLGLDDRAFRGDGAGPL